MGRFWAKDVEHILSRYFFFSWRSRASRATVGSEATAEVSVLAESHLPPLRAVHQELRK